MDTSRLIAQSPIIMGLSSAALILILILSISTPLTTLCLPSHYSLPAIKSLCLEYVCSMWSLLSSRAHHSTEPVLFTPRNLFLLVNLIVLFLLINLHLQKHAPAAAGKRSSRKKRQQRTEKVMMDDVKQAAPLETLRNSSLALDLTGPAEAAILAKEALLSSECAAELLSENLQTEAAPVQESFKEKLPPELPAAAGNDVGSLVQESRTVDSNHNNGAEVEQIVLEEDGRLRLICGHLSPSVGGPEEIKGSDEAESESGRLGCMDSVNDPDAEKMVVEEDGQLRLVESTDGSDAEKIVLEGDGRLRLIDRPPVSSSFRASIPAQKALSAGDSNPNVDNNPDASEINLIINHDYSGDNELNNNGTLTIDLSLSQNINNEHANDASVSSSKSAPLVRASARPIRAKKSDSMDATWRAISSNRGSAANGNRNRKHLIRQKSRQDFKPSRAASNNNNNNRQQLTAVRREPSIGQDELNAKVESFIAKFNEQIRIQRQQSLLTFMQMVDRGT